MCRKTWAKRTRIMLATVWGSLPEEARHHPEHICSLFDYLSNGSTLKAGVKKVLGQEQTSHTLSSHSIYHYFICMCDMWVWKKCMAVRSQLYRIKHTSKQLHRWPSQFQEIPGPQALQFHMTTKQMGLNTDGAQNYVLWPRSYLGILFY